VLRSAGQPHEAPQFEALIAHGAVPRSRRGRPRKRPTRVVADKGYSSKAIRHFLRRRGIRYTIPRRSNERRSGPFDRTIYRTRNQVERLINKLKQFRRVATRYEQYAENYRAMVVLRCILLWL
jgi:transposase